MRDRQGIVSWYRPAMMVVAMALLAWAALSYIAGRRVGGTLVCRATNAGAPLAAEAVEVDVRPAGQVELVSGTAVGQPLILVPGSYDVRGVLAESRDRQTVWHRGLTVDSGGRATATLAFSAGALRVRAMVGAAEAAGGEVVVYVFRAGNHGEPLTAIGAGERIVLGAGRYDLRVVLAVSAMEKDVRWVRNVQVEAGRTRTVDVAFRRGVLLVAARNAGEALPDGAVEVTVYRAGDDQEEVLDSGVAGAPLGLPVGRYDIRAVFVASHDRPEVRHVDVAVKEDATTHLEADFSSGTLAVRATQKGGEDLNPHDAYVYYYRAGEHLEAVAYTPAGRPAVLSSGRYDVRVHYFRSHDQPNVWLRDVEVVAGRSLTRTVAFPSGRLRIRAFGPDGQEWLGDNVFVGVYAPGERRLAIARGRSGEAIVLTEGAYDVRVVDTRVPDHGDWLEGVLVGAGGLTERAVILTGAGR